MEASPLSLAHSHARNAADETHKANKVAASEEHDLAAGEFANAAKTTRDHEALRIMRLLEREHQKLAELLKARPDEAPPPPGPSPAAASLASAELPAPATPPAPTPTPPPPPPTTTTPVPAESSPRRVPPAPSSPSLPGLHREPSSSIASKLASARGIPPNRQRRAPNQPPAQVTAQVAEGRLVNPRRSMRPGGREVSPASERSGSARSVAKSPGLDPSRSRPPKPVLDLARPAPAMAHPSPSAAASVTPSDDPFARFYSTFGNLISTLSAPLAFAGLPLHPAGAAEPGSPTKADGPGKSKAAPAAPTAAQRAGPGGNSGAAAAAAADADLVRLFSKAALRAVQGDKAAPPLGHPAESFYVVPATGGTMSYAGMLAGGRQASALTEDGDDDFVDASETPLPPGSPGLAAATGAAAAAVGGRRRPGSRAGPMTVGAGGGFGGRGAAKTYEELAVENESLKAALLDLGDRLRAFELSSQKQSIAMHTSMRAFSSPTGSTSAATPRAGAGGGATDAPPPLPTGGFKVLEEKIRDMEQELQAAQKEGRRLGKENSKLKEVIHRYREKWESLKVGARGRAKGESKGADDGAEDIPGKD